MRIALLHGLMLGRVGNPWALTCIVLLITACASGRAADTAVQDVSPHAQHSPQEPVTQTRAVRPDPDGDGLPGMQDRCALLAAKTESGCPAEWAYVFIRVIDARQSSVRAALAIEPAVHRLTILDDGYAGMLAPGTYRIRVEAEGFKPRTAKFTVAVDEKALLELQLDPDAGERDARP